MLALLIATHFIIILFIKYVNLLIVKFLLFNARAPQFLSIFVNQNAESLLSHQLFIHLYHFEIYSFDFNIHHQLNDYFFYNVFSIFPSLQ